MIGETVARYRITRELGAGGMGVVYQARDLTLDRDVALKFLPPHAVDSPEARRRFIQEAKAASALDHPNICTVHEIAEHDGRTYIAMACYEGGSLKERLDEGPLPARDIIDIASQIAAGMQKAHGKGILHRDLKPANIIVTSDGIVKVVDFGLAVTSGVTRLTRAGTSVGTPAYMAPECLQGGQADARTDIWALGVMIYEMMAGRPPFRAEFEGALVYEIVHRDPEAPRLSRTEGATEDTARALSQVCGKCLAKDPADRYQTMGEVLTDLLGSAEGQVRASGSIPPSSRVSGRRVFQAVAAVLIAVAAFWVGTRGKPEAGRASQTLAVVPLQVVAATEDYFADGITGELIVKLGRVRGMRVIARSSVMKFKGTSAPPQEVAAELGADLVLTGTIQSAGGQVRVTAELIEASRDTLIWTDSFSRDVKDVLILQSDIAMEIVRQVLDEISPAQELALTTNRRIEPVVFESYLRGKQKLEAAEFARAREHFERAIELDPTFALAHAGLASALQRMGHFGVAKPADVFPLAEEAAQAALALEPDLAEALTALANVTYQQHWKWLEAERLFRRATDLDPGSSVSLHDFAYFLLNAGRFEECIAAARRCVVSDPLNEITHLVLGYMLFYSRDWGAAEDHFQGMIERWPQYRWAKRELAWTYVASGRPEEAFLLYDELGDWPDPELDPWLVRAWVAGGRAEDVRSLLAATKRALAPGKAHGMMPRIAHGHLVLGETDSTLVWLDRLEQLGATVTSGRLAYEVAVTHALLDQKTAALHWLTRACDLRAPQLLSMKCDWDLDSLRDDPRFAAIEARVGFPGS